MSIRVGILSTAHVHTRSFVNCATIDPRVSQVIVFDEDQSRGQEFATQSHLTFEPDLETICRNSDAVIICSENLKHLSLIEPALKHGCHILCEKPVAASREQLDAITELSKNHPKQVQMTAFPCPFSPTFKNLEQRVKKGDLGKIVSACTTNQGKCPGGWFTDPSLSGGGAMIDHVVHVTDLLRRILHQDPTTVQAQVGHNMYGQTWEDVAMVTVGFPNGAFATIDSSWSRPKSYKSWGNVTLNLIGELGVAETDLFVQGMDISSEKGIVRHGTGSNIDHLMVQEFFSAIEENRAPAITLEDGLWASRVAIAAYASVKEKGQPQPV